MKRIFTNLHLVDVETGDVVSGKSLVVENGRVCDLTSEAGQGESLSLGNSYVLPGLIDAHVHLIWEGQPDPNRFTLTETLPMTAYRAGRSAWRSLSLGVTTVRDLGGPAGVPIALSRAIDDGIMCGCRVLPAGRPIAQTGGHVHTMSREADGPDEVRKAVREQIKAGCGLIKLMCSGGAYTAGESIHTTQFTPEEIRAAVQEAKRAERRVAAHALPESAILNCLDSGVDTVEHAALLSDESISAFERTGAFMVPTLAPYHLMASRGAERGVPDYAISKSVQVMEHYVSSLERAAAKGVNIALGTDAGSPMLPHPTLPYEAWLWNREAGLDVLPILKAATVDSARALGWDFELGLLKPGFYADFVLYERNPLEDITVLHFPKGVFKAGQKVADGGVVWSNPLTKERR